MTTFRRIMFSVFVLLLLLVPFAQSSAQPGYYHRRYYRRHYYHRPYYGHPYYRRHYYHRRYGRRW